MQIVRVGVIGMGNMGRYHADYLLKGQVKNCQLTAICSTSPAKLANYQDLAVFDDAGKLIRSGQVDAVIIATPHYQHTTFGIDALENGLHIMVEKPVSAHKADALRLIAAHQKSPQLVFACMFQLRTEPRYTKIRHLITSGELGDLVRMSWIITDWYRTEAYYRSGGWRATWRGEGGGVLLNQCLHNLDTLQWLCGMPVRVRGFCQIGRYHDIEVEDNVSSYLEWGSGMTGVFITSTGEAPGTNRFELAGTRGKAVLEHNKLTFTRNEVSMSDFSKTAKTGFGRPDVWHVEIPFDNAPAPHASVLQDFVDAILQHGPLIAPGAEGVASVELANAMLFSSLTGKTIELPLDADAYEHKLKELIGKSTFQKQPVQSTAEDFTKSFTR